MAFIYRIQFSAFTRDAQFKASTWPNNKYFTVLSNINSGRAIGREKKNRYINFMTDDRIMV